MIFKILIIINAYKLVSFNLGKGRGIALSKVAVEVNQWYRATIERIEQNFTLCIKIKLAKNAQLRIPFTGD